MCMRMHAVFFFSAGLVCEQLQVLRRERLERLLAVGSRQSGSSVEASSRPPGANASPSGLKP